MKCKTACCITNQQAEGMKNSLSSRQFSENEESWRRDILDLIFGITPSHIKPLGFAFADGSYIEMDDFCDMPCAHKTKGFKSLFCCIIFSGCRLNVGNSWLLQIFGSIHQRRNFGIGVTTCDPSQLSADILPADSDDLMNRQEYWVMNKNFSAPGTYEYFIISMGKDGCLRLLRSGHDSQDLFTFNTSQPLWIFVDFGDHVNSIHSFCMFTCDGKIAGSASRPSAARRVGRDRSPALCGKHIDDKACDTDMYSKCTSPAEQKLTASSTDRRLEEKCSLSLAIAIPDPPSEELCSTTRKAEPTDSMISRCLMCLVNRVQTVIYGCGHMCFCDKCARCFCETATQLNCPICRRVIINIIRVS